MPFLLHYVTSKGAIVAFTRALAKELGKDNVLVNCVAPGFTMSAGVEAHPEVVEKLRDVSVAARTLQRDQVPEDVVGAVVFLCGPGSELRHRPDDRDRRRPDLPLILRARRPSRRRRDRARRPRRLRRRARRGALRRRARRRARARLGARPSGPRGRRGSLRCDRVDFPPGGVAYLHTHPGPGLRVLLNGRDPDRAPQGTSHEYGPFEWWYETGPDPGATRPRPRPRTTAFVRVLRAARASGRASARSATSTRPTRRSRSCSAPRVYFERSSTVTPRRGGKLLVDQLVVHGTDIVFCVPGESYLEVLDGLYDAPIRLITCRHEAGAANMADAYGKLTGRPGVCLVTRGPGATHASVGVHTAFQDSTPLILLVGQVASDQEEREAFQEVDYRRMFGPMAKWVAQIDRADRIPEYVARAFATACSGRPGTGRARAARGHARARERRRRRAAVPRRCSRIPARAQHRARCAALLAARRAAARDPRRRGLDAAARRPTCARSSRRTRCRRARRSGARTRSTTTRRATSATSASASTRSSRRACGRPTCCSSSGRGSAR